MKSETMTAFALGAAFVAVLWWTRRPAAPVATSSPDAPSSSSSSSGASVTERLMSMASRWEI